MALGPQWRPCPCPATPQASCASAEVQAAPRGSGGRAGVDPACLQVIPPPQAMYRLRAAGCAGAGWFSGVQAASQARVLPVEASRDLSGAPVVGDPPANAGTWGSIPGLGGSCLPQGNQVCTAAAEPTVQSLSSATSEAATRGAPVRRGC